MAQQSSGRSQKVDQARQLREAKSTKPEVVRPSTLEETRQRREAKSTKGEEVRSPTLEEVRQARKSKQKPSPVPPLVGNQYFRVYFGKTLISFARVSNLQRSLEHEEVVEGGLNGFIHVLTKPGTQAGTLTLEKGVVADESVTAIMEALGPGARISVPVTITLYHRDEEAWQPVRSWGFEDGVVTRWELTELDGLGSTVAIEKLEISHAGLVEYIT